MTANRMPFRMWSSPNMQDKLTGTTAILLLYWLAMDKHKHTVLAILKNS
jgi:hypothetical protein